MHSLSTSALACLKWVFGSAPGLAGRYSARVARVGLESPCRMHSAGSWKEVENPSQWLQVTYVYLYSVCDMLSWRIIKRDLMWHFIWPVLDCICHGAPDAMMPLYYFCAQFAVSQCNVTVFSIWCYQHFHNAGIFHSLLLVFTEMYVMKQYSISCLESQLVLIWLLGILTCTSYLISCSQWSWRKVFVCFVCSTFLFFHPLPQETLGKYNCKQQWVARMRVTHIDRKDSENIM